MANIGENVEKVVEAAEEVVAKAPKMIEAGKAVGIAVVTFVGGVFVGIGGCKAAKKIKSIKANKVKKLEEDLKDVSKDAKNILNDKDDNEE